MNREITYLFQLEIHRVFITLNFKGQAVIQWGKHKNCIKTRNKISFNQNQKYLDVNQKLRSKGVCHIRDGKFKHKQSTIQIWLYSNSNESKQINGGNLKLDMTEILSTKELLTQVSRNYQQKILNGPIPGSYIQFTLTAKLSTQNHPSENDISFQGDYSKNLDMTFRVNDQRMNERVHTIPERPSYDFEKKTGERPLQFSFSPAIINQKNRFISESNNDEIKNLLHKLQEKDKDINHFYQQNQQLKNLLKEKQFRQNKEHKNSSQKVLQLMNKYNQTVIQLDNVKKQKSEIQRKYQNLKQQRNDTLANFTKNKSDYEHQRAQMSSRYEQKKKQIIDLTSKIQNLRRQNEDIKAQVFKYQSQLINLENKCQQKIKQLQRNKKQLIMKNDKISQQLSQAIMQNNSSIKDFKINYDKFCIDRQQLQSQLLKCKGTISKQQQTIEIIRKENQNLQKEILLQRQTAKNKYSILQQKFKEKQIVVSQIQKQFNHINSQKTQTNKVKQQQLASIRQKFNSACKKIDLLSSKQQSYENKISQLTIRIQNLEQICNNHEKELNQKQMILQKAKNYINQKQTEINERQQFIQKAKIYIQKKQKEVVELRSKSQILQGEFDKLNIENQRLNNIVSCKQFENNNLFQEERIQQLQNELQEMQRKFENQEAALQDLISKNLQYQIQLTVKNTQLQSVRSKC